MNVAVQQATLAPISEGWPKPKESSHRGISGERARFIPRLPTVAARRPLPRRLWRSCIGPAIENFCPTNAYPRKCLKYHRRLCQEKQHAFCLHGRTIYRQSEPVYGVFGSVLPTRGENVQSGLYEARKIGEIDFNVAQILKTTPST
jgi:hypothetical protein